MNQIKRITACFLIFSIAFSVTQCKNAEKKESKTEEVMTTVEKTAIAKSTFGTTPDGEVDVYTLKNKNGMQVGIMTLGGIITSWTAPDKEGNYKDIVLGFNSLEEYLQAHPFFGALIGRYGNRIANGKFSLDGVEYQLTPDGKTQLHGGVKGFDKVIWTVVSADVVDGASTLQLKYLSKDGEEGYPGNLTSIVTYTLEDDDTLSVNYKATTDKKTVVNLTQHTYFNLSGDFSKDILDHEVVINANEYVPVGDGLIPTGELAAVEGTPFDFRVAKAVGKEINNAHDQIKRGGGYDHNWVLTNQNEGIRLVASAHHPGTGRLLEVFSDEPGVQFYTGNFLDGSLASKDGGTYGKRTGLCLETQHYPDSPNQPQFPTTTLDVGETYNTTTKFKFSTK